MDRHKIQLSSRHMGGEFLFQIFPGTSKGHKEIESIAHLAFDEVKRIEELLTVFKDSPFNDINKYAGIRPVEVDAETLKLVKESLDLSLATNGAFDISFSSQPGFIGYKNIEVDEKNSTIFLPRTEMRINLGGIGKGYAVDCGFEVLRRFGLSNFYFNGAGDIRVHSRTDAPRSWKIGVRNPFSVNQNQACAYLEISNGALATSGTYVKGGHIINPESGTSCDELVSVTVCSDSAQTSDTTATVVMIMGKQKGMDYLNQHNFNAFAIDCEGHVHRTERSFAALENRL